MEARDRRDWAAADALKARIEAAGWRVTDNGRRSSVSPAMPATLEVAGELRYGSAAAVPSALDAPATAAWTVALVASETPDAVSRLLAALRAHAPGGTQVVVVANDPSDSQAAALQLAAPDLTPIGGSAPEVLRTSTRLGFAAALNIGLRRATGEIVLLADGSAWPTGDALSPLAAALADPAVAAAGGFGLVAPEQGPLRPNALQRPDSPPAVQDVVALEAGWLAFRRSDYRELGPLDEHFLTPAWLDVWWTLRLRVGAEPDAPEPSPVRRAVRLELPLSRDEAPWPPDRSRLNRRNMYRVLDRFGPRDDLA
jgi:glycosyltransferase involved in cell wall biosynthesis